MLQKQRRDKERAKQREGDWKPTSQTEKDDRNFPPIVFVYITVLRKRARERKKKNKQIKKKQKDLIAKVTSRLFVNKTEWERIVIVPRVGCKCGK